MKSKKILMLLATTALLAACDNAPKQKQINADEASQIAAKIELDAVVYDQHHSAPEAFTIKSSDKESYRYRSANFIYSCSSENITYCSYSKEKNIYFMDVTTKTMENDDQFEYKYQTWLVEENGKTLAYVSATEYGEEVTFTVEEIEKTVEEYAFTQLIAFNSSQIYLDFSFFCFSDENPVVPDFPDKEKITYTSYYGSDNEDSLQIKEKIVTDFTNRPEYQLPFDYLYTGKETYRREINIKNTLVTEAICESKYSEKANVKNVDCQQEKTNKFAIEEKSGNIPELDFSKHIPVTNYK